MSRIGPESGLGTGNRGFSLGPARAGRAWHAPAVLSLWAIGYEAACTVGPGLLHTLPWDGIGPDVAFALAGVLVIARSTRLERGWVLIGLGALCWAAGDVYCAAQPCTPRALRFRRGRMPAICPFCPLTLVGILSLVRKRAKRAPKALVADALAASLAVGGISAAVVVQPVLSHTSGGTLAIATNLAYPLVDMLLLGLIVGATALGRWRLERTWVLFLGYR